MNVISRLPEPAPSAAIVVMTTVYAQKLLDGNTHNRAVRRTVVERYARDMAAGRWQLNGETIKVSRSGVILDGQHRLLAVVLAGIAVEMLVIYDLPEDVQDTIDRGMNRLTSDVLRLHGESGVNILSGAISIAVCVEAGGDWGAWPSTPEALAYLEANPTIRDSVLVAREVRLAIPTPEAIAAAAHHVAHKCAPIEADEFFHAIASGVALGSDSPVLRLREVLIREAATKQRKLPRRHLTALYIKAWNASRRGMPMKRLAWKPGEVFPQPE